MGGMVPVRPGFSQCYLGPESSSHKTALLLDKYLLCATGYQTGSSQKKSMSAMALKIGDALEFC
jgi:hypothetical protein